jgi:hypothetical protein
MTPAGRGLPNQQPKDSPEYREWHAKLVAGIRESVSLALAFEPRACVVDGVTFTPRVGNQKRCDACIAAGRWHQSAHKRSA